LSKASGAAEQEFTTGEGLAYFVGSIGLQLITTMTAEWGVFFYCPPKGTASHSPYTSLSFATMIMAISLILNAVSSPIAGFWSDNTKSRFGRRRPYIIFASIPLTVCFVLFWHPPVQGVSSVNFIWGLSFLIAYCWLLSMVTIPFIALMPEMARTTQGRIKLSVYNAVGMIIGLVLGLMSGLFIQKIGFMKTAVLFGIVGLSCFQVAGWCIKERYVSDGSETSTSLKELFIQLGSSLRNRPFLIFIVAVTTFNLGFYVIQIALPDYNAVILHKDTDFVTYLFIPFLLVCLPLTFFIEKFVGKWNKKVVYAAGILGFAVLFPLLGPIGMVKAENVRLILLLLMVGVAGAPQAINYVLAGPMIGEIADYDEKLTGRRREAIYSGAINFGYTVAMSLGYLVRWAVYSPFGEFTVKNAAPVLLIGPVTGVISLMGFFIFLKYPVLHVVRGEDGSKKT
jgi:glycoside/pentoside/hexuronide:cation symporter, GPH family